MDAVTLPPAMDNSGQIDRCSRRLPKVDMWQVAATENHIRNPNYRYDPSSKHTGRLCGSHRPVLAMNLRDD